MVRQLGKIPHAANESDEAMDEASIRQKELANERLRE